MTNRRSDQARAGEQAGAATLADALREIPALVGRLRVLQAQLDHAMQADDWRRARDLTHALELVARTLEDSFHRLAGTGS